MKSPIAARIATSEDLPFVYSSWFKSHRPYAKHVSASILTEEIRRLVQRSKIIVAVSADYPDEILGYSVSDGGDVLHFAYVKSVYRRMGIGRGLVQNKFKWYTHWMGEQGRTFADVMNLTYNPYLTRSTLSPQ